MIIDKIRNKFKEITTPILLFFDPEQEYREEVLAIDEPDFKVLEVNNNYFKVKYEIEILHPGSKFLLYHPFARPSKYSIKEYPLADLLYANQELIVDESADILSKYAIHHAHAPLILQYKRFVKAAKYQTKLLPVLTAKPFNEYKFKNAILSLILNEKKIANDTFNLIGLFELLNQSEEQWDKQWKAITREKLTDVITEIVYNCTHIQLEEVSANALQSLFLKLKYNIITKNSKEASSKDPYKQLKITDDVTLSKIDVFFKEWSDDKTKGAQLEEVMLNLGKGIDETKIVEAYDGTLTFGIKTQQIMQHEIKKLLADIKDNPNQVVETLKDWQVNNEVNEDFDQEIDFIKYTALYYRLRRNYSDFDFNFIEDYIQKYQQELYKLDGYYRHAYTAYQHIEKEKEAKDFTEVFQELNKNYDQFLIEINQAWMKILAENDFNLNATKIKKQYNFYKDFVAVNPNKKVVIISDGFRFELAKDLINELKVDATNAIDLEAIVASIPSYTNLGMSNLLPNNGIEAIVGENSIDYAINGIKTNSTNREKILQQVEPNALVLDYASFMRLGVVGQREILKPARLVYIYHNWMDNIGDKRSSEYYTFEAAEQCVDQLKLLIKKLYSSLNIYNIYVTADHGFLFNYNEIKENSRQVFPSVTNCLKEHTRFCITLDKQKSKDLFTVPLENTTNIQTEAAVLLPKGINRFRKLGGFGVQFVHGGASLQELIVPVIQLSRQRNTKFEEVTFTRLDQVRSMATSSAKFKILQDQAVGDKYKGTSVLFALYDLDNHLISNEVEIKLEAVSEQPSERMFEFKLDLNALGSSTQTAYLKAYNTKDLDRLNPIINDLIKINTLTEIDEF
ncbi:BREX-1 system phosphatase PglZ type A [Xiashengella succiniciproducens]|uniref:BREX-1 system phosphatase PglZ type A n=1 Tax=Xiashengella succiniciproducens TaxID=2949635 RepID=A0A9J6ZRV4_9BACT|nr:BREX-1 system phosphatase PglZ type A [Alkaliflexus sp. Ai-910]URW80668.1 BREX-1 system phosphatase PglZ type A [Alkaliflexus sp. Ai-910]